MPSLAGAAPRHFSELAPTCQLARVGSSLSA
eukprot:CAMPEP_0168685416 /NCGR_PEP_ID=MMETSP0503-20121227/29424_1 /TAXON_ID=89963 /ORGANISM="Heterocapsa rotundata, Strain SCCAP K-0483" /LENGTH=30 /DNA_ID= /DNA_START= /DNA_END= /DNA_ORIENTATION=